MAPKIYPVRQSFNSGEVSELVGFRDDVSKYNSACLTLENAVPLVEGGAKKMPGTYFAGATALGGAMFTASISGTTMTVTAVNYGVLKVGQDVVGSGVFPSNITAFGSGTGGVGTYTMDSSQTVSSRMMQTSSNGHSRLVPFQFSTEQGAILEFSRGIVRIWEGATQGSWSLGIALKVPPGSDYDPTHLYSPGDVVLIGSYNVIYAGTSATMFIAAPYGTTNAYTVPISFTVNSADSLVVSVTGSSPNQGLNIALANATAANNSAVHIQAGIRGLVSLNVSSSNFVDLSHWTVTPTPAYFATPWITVPGNINTNTWANGNAVGVCALGNQNDQFPFINNNFNAWNTTYWNEYAFTTAPIELVTPYLEGDLFQLDCSTQSADVLWVFHQNYPPAIIERLSANSWKYSLSLPGQQPGEPPYRGTLGQVKTGYSALGQSITDISQASPCVVKVAATGFSFQDGDRIYINEVAGMVEINQGEFIVRTPSVSAGILSFALEDPNTGNPVDSTGYLKYVSGGFAVQVVPLFSQPGDYPACGTLYQERLGLGGSLNNPTQMNASVQGDYPNFICDPNAEDFAIQFTLVSTKLDQILNMIGSPNALVIGTAGGVWIMSGSNGQSLSQLNVTASKQTSMGVSSLQPQLVGSSAIFVSRSTRIVLFMIFNFVSNQWDNYDLTRLNRVITLGPDESTSGIAQTAYQSEPYPILWAVRNDGQLIGLVFNTQDQVYAWFRVNMLPGIIESAAVISGENQEDQLVVVVARNTNGVTQRYVEYFMPQEIFSQLSNAFFVNCGQQLKLAPPTNITAITNANPTNVYSSLHGLTTGMQVNISGVQGMDEINQDATQAYTVGATTINQFDLVGMDSTGFGVYTGGGVVKQVTNQVTGMSYLLGQNVVAVGDGAIILQPTPVTSDVVMFPYYANQITIGLPYQMTVRPTNPVLTTQGATSRGEQQKMDSLAISLYQSMGGKFGTDLNHMYDITYGPGTMGQQPQMSTFDSMNRDMDADWDDKSTVYITQGDPLPFTLRGLVLSINVNPD